MKRVNQLRHDRFARNIRGRVEVAQEDLVKWLNNDSKASERAMVERLIKRLVELPRLASGTKEQQALFRRYWKTIKRDLKATPVWPVLTGISARGTAYFNWASFHAAGPVVVMDVVTLASEGLLGTLRKCPQCGRWLVARKSDQKFCSEKCRNDFHMAQRKTPEFREYMRRYMHGYRKLTVVRRKIKD